jgi:hypothetical protein
MSYYGCLFTLIFFFQFSNFNYTNILAIKRCQTHYINIPKGDCKFGEKYIFVSCIYIVLNIRYISTFLVMRLRYLAVRYIRLKYLGTAVTNRNLVQEDIKGETGLEWRLL